MPLPPAMPDGMRAILHRPDGFGIAHLRGAPRAALTTLMQQHYLGVSGNVGLAFGVYTPAQEIVGGALIGATASESCSRSIAAADYPIRAIKRSFILDELPGSVDNSCVPVPESQMLRACMDEVADLAQAPVIFVSYADPAAVDIRVDPPRPLLGRVYVGAGFFFAGWSRGRRLVAIDTDGCARSTRQGPVALTSRNIAQLRPGWQLVAAPPLRVWLAVVPPRHHVRNGRRRAATSAWRRRVWYQAWATLHPDRRIAARQWVATDAWQQLVRAGQTPITEHTRVGAVRPLPTRLAGAERRQAAWWQGAQLQPDAVPVWVPEPLQTTLELIDATPETTAYRTYLPRLHASASVR